MATASTGSSVAGDMATNLQVFWRSLALVGIAELFDKTWFMGLLLALRHGAPTVFVGSFAALFLHTILAAAFGFAVAKFLHPSVLNFVAAGLFLLFAILYAKDWWSADPEGDAIASGRKEAEEDFASESEEDAESSPMRKARAEGRSPEGAGKDRRWLVLARSFTCVFIAEWGDRTQIAMVGQHASQPLVPVFLGSVVAFFLLTLSAVGFASVVSTRHLSERLVHGVGALSFLVFAGLALKDALSTMAAKQPGAALL